MKTAVSIPDALFKKADELARELHLSRSQLFADAVRDYIEKRNNEMMLEALNKVYAEDETNEEKEVRKQSKKYYARSIKAEKW